MNITIPHNFQPRFYQLPLLRALDSGIKRACWVVHRRAGKDKTAVNFTAKKMFERVGSYFHCLPSYNQGRKVLWDGRDKDGFKFTDHMPLELRKSTNNTEMKIEMVNGSVWQVVGADNYDSVVGANPVGIVFSEWAISDRYPQAWEYFRPILAENGGWAIFIYTPRGRNHGWDLYQMALRNKGWFCQLLTIDDTGAISAADVNSEREAGMSEDMIQQEFYCSFLASTENIVIPFTFIVGAQKRQAEYERSPRYAGCDPARFGNDRTGFVIRQGGAIIHAEGWRNLDVVQSAGKIVDLHRRRMFDAVAIDVIGIGAGVYDLVKTAGVPCVPVNVAESPSMQPERFGTMRDELWWKVREYFEDLTSSVDMANKGVRELISDIQDIRYSYSPTGKIKIEGKDEMKKRLGFSPDLGDALCCTFAPGLEFKIKRSDYDPYYRQEKSNDWQQYRDNKRRTM